MKRRTAPQEKENAVVSQFVEAAKLGEAFVGNLIRERNDRIRQLVSRLHLEIINKTLGNIYIFKLIWRTNPLEGFDRRSEGE